MNEAMTGGLIATLISTLPAVVPDGFAPSGVAPAVLPALALLGLGALHGINPGMGWLFAVGLGIQRRDGAQVWRALPPLAVGHALAIAAALTVASVLGTLLPLTLVKWTVGALLVGFGGYRLVRTRHPRYGGMLVGPRELVTWSFLMASAHGAGLMVVPLVPVGHLGHAVHGHSLAGVGGDPLAALVASGLHTIGYLVVAGLVAALVYRRLGVRILRTHWLNLDLVWSGALVATGVLTVVL